MAITNDHGQRSGLSDGRLDLEEQGRRAEQLLRAAREGHAAARARFAEGTSHATTPPDQEAGLAHAQAIIAREHGFPSWPRLREHYAEVESARHRVQLIGDRDLATVHIRPGSDIQQAMRQAGFAGDYLEFSDPLCMGPVRRLPTEEHLRVRARYLAGAFDMPQSDTLLRLRRQYEALDRARTYQRIVLWFEHDAYDQLCLSYALKRLAELKPSARIELINVAAVPGVERFVGIGQLAPEVLAWLWQGRRHVTDRQLTLAHTAWSALTAPTPIPIDQMARAGTPDLPLLGRALARHLRELPSARTGLSLTETLTLEVLRDSGPMPVGRVFRELLVNREPLPFLGDLMFWWVVRSLLNGKEPLLEVDPATAAQNWPQRMLSLTEAGAAVLAGRRHWLDLNRAERWLGGIRIAGQRGCWCFDEQADRPLWRMAAPVR